MSGLKTIELELEGTRDLALISADDAVWLVVPIRWWDLSTLLFWLFAPNDKKARVSLTITEKGQDGARTRVSFWAMRVAKRHMRVRGLVT